MTAPNAFDPTTIKLRAELNEARAVVGFFRPTIRPLLLSELTWRMAGWNGQRTLLERHSGRRVCAEGSDVNATWPTCPTCGVNCWQVWVGSPLRLAQGCSQCTPREDVYALFEEDTT
jgi:hypothetical protein